jgi:hypothetical protein
VSTQAPSRPALRSSVVVLGAAAGLSSGAALVATILLGWSLALGLVFIAVPALVAVAAASATARREEQALFLARLRFGAIAGILGTAGYDGIRAGLQQIGLAGGIPFAAIPLFGTGLTGLSPRDPVAIAAGWAFHAVNGVGFAIAYTLVAAGRPWYWGIIFALFLEAMMVTLYPGWLHMGLTTDFLTLSVSGHFVYGAVLGSIAQRTP